MKKAYTRLQLAESQLRSAMGLFMTGQDRFSVITLAGAADVILARLVLKAGKVPFTDTLLQADPNIADLGMTREVYGKAINDVLGINQLKHMDRDDDGYFDIEPEDCALAAILKALANYTQIEDHDRDLVNAFKLWLGKNLDLTKWQGCGCLV